MTPADGGAAGEAFRAECICAGDLLPHTHVVAIDSFLRALDRLAATGCPECGFNTCMCDGSPNNPDLDYPAGAIENGREYLRRLGEYRCEAGRIEMSTDYQEAVRCFEWLVGACERYADTLAERAK